MFPDPFNPFGVVSDAASQVVTDGWTRIMLSLWNSGVWLLKLVLHIEDYFLTPDISADGPARPVYQATMWLGLSLMIIMVMVQLGTAAIRRDGKSIGRALIGTAQFVIVWVISIAYATAVIVACAGLNKAFLQALFGVNSLGEWDPWAPFTGQDVSNAVIATVLGLLGMLVWLAGIAHLLVMLTRAGALIVLAVTTPISAAGLVSEVGRGWFWKSLRWFHAAAFAPVLMTLMMGMGIQLASGAAAGMADSAQAGIATALPAVVMILTSTVSPVALFKLLAFTDPGTSSGAAVRAGMSAIGGLGGLLQGRGDDGSATASMADGQGRSSGEGQAETTNTSRMMTAAGGVAGVLGPAGAAIGTALKTFAAAGGAAASLSNDLTNQMGVGHNTYQPDWINPGSKPPSRRPSNPDAGDNQTGEADSGSPRDEFTNPYEPAPSMPPDMGSPASGPKPPVSNPQGPMSGSPGGASASAPGQAAGPGAGAAD